MRLLTVLAVVAALLLPAAALAGETKTFGKGLTGTDRTKIADLVAKPEQFVGKTVRVEGVASKVCEHRGCWVEIAADGAKMRVKVDDGVIVFPRDVMGKRLAAEGVFTKKVIPGQPAAAKAHDHAKHAGGECAEHAAKPAADTVVYQIAGTGAVLL